MTGQSPKKPSGKSLEPVTLASRIFSISQEAMESIDIVQITDLIRDLLVQAFTIQLPANGEAIFPLLDSFIEFSLELARAFREERRGYSALNPEGEEIPDVLVEVQESNSESRQVPLIEYGRDFSNWALHKIVPIKNPRLRDENSENFFTLCAEIGVLLKRRGGKMPQELSRFFAGINHQTLARLARRRPKKTSTRRLPNVVPNTTLPPYGLILAKMSREEAAAFLERRDRLESEARARRQKALGSDRNGNAS